MGKTPDYEHGGHPQKRLRPPEAKTTYHQAQLKPDQIERQMATDEKRTFKDDAEIVRVNLTMTGWTDRMTLHRFLSAKRLARHSFEEEYLDQLLAYLLKHRKIVEQDGCWKRT